jgi:SAM-dependent methyltransferase
VQVGENESGRPKMTATVSPFDAFAAAYDAWFEEEGRLPFDIEVEALRPLLPLLPKPWLEVGVGSGRFAQALGIGLGLDPSVRLLELARNRGIEVVLGKGERTPFRDESFGTVFLIVTV